MAAPSGKNLRPWHFVVVTDRGRLDRLAEKGTYWKMLHEAPLAIVVCGDPAISDRYYDQDSVAATENILLAVSMLGLGGVWLGCHPNPERMDPVREILGIPGAIVPISIISIGHPARGEGTANAVRGRACPQGPLVDRGAPRAAAARL